jgi:archaellum component FlaG (FlaF/FlaG flagellin family)
VVLVNPSLTYDSSTDVYTLGFWIKNNTSSQMRAVTRVRVRSSYSYPEITAADCPESTPGYQWALRPGELSPQLGVAFASSATNPRTVIDMTCGSKSVLKSFPYGFADYPPFEWHIEGLLASGAPYVLDATVQ